MKYRLDDGKIEVVDDAIAAIPRTKTPAERVAMGFQCNRTARIIIENVLRSRHPDWDDQRVAAEVARRMLGGTT